MVPCLSDTLGAMSPALASAAATIFTKLAEAQCAQQQACRERLALIAQRHREVLEIVGYYEGLQAAYEHLRRIRPLDTGTARP